MSIKRLAATAAVAAVLGMSTSTVNAGFAGSVPLDPAPCPSWERGCSGSTPAPNNPGYGGAGSQPPMAPAPHSTQPPPSTYQPPHSTQAPPSTYQPPHTTAPPTTSWQKPPTTSMPTASTCPNWEKDCTPAPNPGPGYGGATSPTTAWQQPITPNGPTTSMPVECPAWEKNCTPAPNPGPGYGGATPTTTGAPWNGSSPPPGWNGSSPQPGPSGYPTPTRPVLNAPWTQPPHPPYYPPRPPILHPTDQYGGPTNLPTGGYWVPGQGAPPPPPPSGYGWSNGPAPGAPPPNWEGPPPSGGWNGPPPAGGWNQPWQGPPVDQSYGQNYYAPFTYNNFTVLPVFNADYGGFGYWFFGVWVPLY